MSPEATMGIVSVILWSLLLIVAFKYAILIMRADNRGEGGMVALLALLDVRRNHAVAVLQRRADQRDDQQRCAPAPGRRTPEDAKPEDLTAGCNVLLNALLERANTGRQARSLAPVVSEIGCRFCLAYCSAFVGLGWLGRHRRKSL